jgi:hypothetical protein
MMMVVALFGALTPGLARGEDARGTALKIVTQVTRLNNEKQYAHAATLAAAGVAREDLADADRVQLAGLARRSFELSYETGGALTDLCGPRGGDATRRAARHGGGRRGEAGGGRQGGGPA